MPRGIQEKDVWEAADALLVEGARPTIERVRQKIGRGSPNTVSPFLETWFKHLGARIKDPGGFAAPADVPDSVLQAARHFWEAALAQTRHDFDERLQDGMAAAVANVEAEKERAALAEAAAFEASGKASRLQHELTESLSRLEQEKLAHAVTLAHLDQTRGQTQELNERVRELEFALEHIRETARRDVATALDRFAAAERRATLEIDAERTARAMADRRAVAMEGKLEVALAEANAAHTRHAEAAARFQGERERLVGELGRTQEQLAFASSRATALAEDLVQAQRDAHAANRQAELAERLVVALKPPAPRRRATKAAKGAARVQREGSSREPQAD